MALADRRGCGGPSRKRRQQQRNNRVRMNSHAQHRHHPAVAQRRARSATAVAVACSTRRVERLAEPAGEILNELPGRAAGAGAARRRPFQRLGFELIGAGSRRKCLA